MNRKPITAFATLIALAAIVAALVSGCGSALSTSGSGTEHGAAELAAVANPVLRSSRAARPRHAYIVRSNDLITDATNAPVQARFPTGHDNDEISPTGAVPVNPCKLVSRGAATGILGGAVRAKLEPQGPTCVYAMSGSRGQQITLVVEESRLGGLRRHARKASKVRVAGRTGWCMRYGSTSVGVALGGGRTLHVTGPCGTAARFAARALPHLQG
jgi:hypothetical protein